MNEIMVCKNLYKMYQSFPALNNINLTLEKGRIYGLLGPNGSGKTTLIKIINGLLTPSMGTIEILGKAPGTETKAVVSYLPDKVSLCKSMTVEQLIGFYSDFFKDFSEHKAYEMLSSLNINPSLVFKSLSKGTQEKVQLILTMSRKAALYCLDEPIGGVDPAARDYILQTILNNYDQESTILISTHLISDIEQILDNVILLKNGKVFLESTVDDIREKEGKSVDSLFREVFRC